MLFFDYTAPMRKTFAIITYTASLMLTPQFALASSAGQASACYNISDADARTYCLARARGESSQCYSIQRPDLRSQCLAEVRK